LTFGHPSAETLIQSPGGADVGRIEQVDTGLKTDVDQTTWFQPVAAASGLEELALAAEGTGVEAQDGD
jgi:hypothetical protein